MKIDTGYLYSNNDSRIFVNNTLGCLGQCSYCYLAKFGYSNTYINNNRKTAEELLCDISKLKKLSKKTLISFGCFSECWDEINRVETKKLIIYFLKRGNQIQISTKKEIKVDDIEEILKYIKYKGQLVIFVSSSTISEWIIHEKNTDEPKLRFKSFEILKNNQIPVILYLKPVLKNITSKDIKLYIKIIKRYKIEDVVVGSIFNESKIGEKVPFSNIGLVYNESTDEQKIKEELINYCNIYTRSTQIMKKYQEKNNFNK